MMAPGRSCCVIDQMTVEMMSITTEIPKRKRVHWYSCTTMWRHSFTEPRRAR